jgi:amino acid permease
MGKQTRKIIKAQGTRAAEAQPQATATREISKKERRQQFWLLTFILFSIVILAVNYPHMTYPAKLMYAMMILSLGATYAKSLKRFSEKVEKALVYASVSTMIMAMILFAYTTYEQFFA